MQMDDLLIFKRTRPNFFEGRVLQFFFFSLFLFCILGLFVCPPSVSLYVCIMYYDLSVHLSATSCVSLKITENGRKGIGERG